MAVPYKRINEEIKYINNEVTSNDLNLERVVVILDPQRPESAMELKNEIADRISKLDEIIAMCNKNEGVIHAATRPSGPITNKRDSWINKENSLGYLRERLEYVRSAEVAWLKDI